VALQRAVLPCGTRRPRRCAALSVVLPRLLAGPSEIAHRRIWRRFPHMWTRLWSRVGGGGEKRW
jgi:hypothetical protein